MSVNIIRGWCSSGDVSDPDPESEMSGTEFGLLVDAAGATLIHGDRSTRITGVTYDSREVSPGDLFVALKGGYVDGHQYLRDAHRNGAVATLVEQNTPAANLFGSAAISCDTRAALAPLAARFFDYPAESLGIIGVTGTDGKTTTSYLIDAMLRANGLNTGLVGTVAIRIADQIVEHDTRQTTPESLEVQGLLAQMRDRNVAWAVLEATSHALALSRLDACPFDIGVITNVTREHLDFHGSIEAYRKAKARLIEKIIESSGRGYQRGAVVNQDDPGARSIGQSYDVPVTWFSTESLEADVTGQSVRVHESGTRFELGIGSHKSEVDLKLIGGYNVFNAMAAAGVGYIIGLSPEEIKNGLESLSHVPGRMQRIDVGQPFNVIVDYAHSPASLAATLELARSFTRGRLIVVSGSAGERDTGKRPVQGRICAERADLAVFTSEDPRYEDPQKIIDEIAVGAAETGAVDGVHFHKIEDRRKAIDFAIARASNDDTVLLAGKGHETCIIYGNERTPWDEAAVAEQLLDAHGYSLGSSGSEG
jgi:UDP-N-acetylmuramoyl-L-alanyl-D-glutamate--2,6-diaminopimelate ligase